MAKWNDTPVICEKTWNEREEYISKLEALVLEAGGLLYDFAIHSRPNSDERPKIDKWISICEQAAEFLEKTNYDKVKNV